MNENRDRLVSGYPKTGRTWLRFMLGNALVDHYSLGLELDLTNIYSIISNDKLGRLPDQPTFAYEGIVPKIEMSHLLYSSPLHSHVNTIFLTCDPRDVMVSHWLHNKYQRHSFGGNLSEFITNPNVGINAFLRHLNSWAPHIHEEQVVTYESMRFNPVDALRKVIDRFRLSIPENTIIDAVEQSDIDTMREKEVNQGIAGHMYDRTNPNALRVRRGVVGGYVNYFSVTDETFIKGRILDIDKASQDVIKLTGYEA